MVSYVFFPNPKQYTVTVTVTKNIYNAPPTNRPVPTYIHIYRVPTPPGKSWFFFLKIPGPGKSWKITLVLESPGN